MKLWYVLTVFFVACLVVTFVTSCAYLGEVGAGLEEGGKGLKKAGEGTPYGIFATIGGTLMVGLGGALRAAFKQYKKRKKAEEAAAYAKTIKGKIEGYLDLLSKAINRAGPEAKRVKDIIATIVGDDKDLAAELDMIKGRNQ